MYRQEHGVGLRCSDTEHYVDTALHCANNFDRTLSEESRDWINQKILTMWDKPELLISVQPRQR